MVTTVAGSKVQKAKMEGSSKWSFQLLCKTIADFSLVVYIVPFTTMKIGGTEKASKLVPARFSMFYD